MLYMMLLIPFVLCLGVVASSFLAGFTPMEKLPAYYRDEGFRKRMEWSFLLAIGSSSASSTSTSRTRSSSARRRSSRQTGY